MQTMINAFEVNEMFMERIVHVFAYKQTPTFIGFKIANHVKLKRQAISTWRTNRIHVVGHIFFFFLLSNVFAVDVLLPYSICLLVSQYDSYFVNPKMWMLTV